MIGRANIMSLQKRGPSVKFTFFFAAVIIITSFSERSAVYCPRPIDARCFFDLSPKTDADRLYESALSFSSLGFVFAGGSTLRSFFNS